MKLSLVLALTLVATALVLPAAGAAPNTFPVCHDKSFVVPGVTAAYVGVDCYDGIYLCDVGQTRRDCDRLVDLTPR